MTFKLQPYPPPLFQRRTLRIIVHDALHPCFFSFRHIVFFFSIFFDSFVPHSCATGGLGSHPSDSLRSAAGAALRGGTMDHLKTARTLCP
ncbi:MAG: hypothetical protein MJZ42_05490 [Bacteroidales bacterium]|nr:hypothetical protein [Bacteroidales bacterium]